MDRTNYRPVALLPSFSKVAEIIIHDQLADHVETANILPNTQHAYRRNRSTFSALSQICSEWEQALAKGESIGCLLFDLSAAFDYVDRDILDAKLKAYNFDHNSRALLYSYLSDRKQCVKAGNAQSPYLDLEFGSPQGAVLSPLLFLICIADKMTATYWDMLTIPRLLSLPRMKLPSACLLYTSPSPRDKRQSRMPSSA